MFFDDHPRFLETSQTAAHRDRLNLRHEAIITSNRHILEGSRVVDIGSHDGRWSCAALRAGAQHVIGIEARQELVQHSNDNFAYYGFPPETYHFQLGDVFDVLHDEKLQPADADVVLCLGFLYHTLRYPDLFSGIRRLRPRHLIIDTAVYDSTEKVVRLFNEPTDRERNAVAGGGARNNRMLTGWPSVPALELMLWMWGFEVEEYVDWNAIIASHPEIEPGRARQYAERTRVTVRCGRRRGRRRRLAAEAAEPADD
jgi:precorrin-6B methylase 2